MKNSPFQNEEKRLEDLYSYNILDTLSEKEYEDITYMASVICDAPIALISLIDSDRQWFKSHQGLEVTETPREHSFCSHAIEISNEPFIVKDSRIDNRFKNNPLVTGEPNIVFYAGVPIVSKNGFGLGTVCVIDDKPRELTDKQIKGLKILTDQVINLLELHRANNKLNFNNVKLEERLVQNIADNVEEVAKKNSALEKMNKELESFTYISSHDLQEPLRKIQMYISLITSDEAENLSIKGKEYLSKINRSALRMRTLIQDLLTYTRSTNSNTEFKKVSFNAILEEVQNDLSEEIEAVQATIHLNEDLEIKVIPFQLKQLFYNLISNSLKFSNPNINPKISIEAVIKDSGSLSLEQLNSDITYYKITLRDNGIGFENKYRNKIFELFQRLDPENTPQGTGIGLAIVKKIVDNHNGLIFANGKVNEGVVFEIYIPVT